VTVEWSDPITRLRWLERELDRLASEPDSERAALLRCRTELVEVIGDLKRHWLPGWPQERTRSRAAGP
jgi:hypothetical protein